MREGQEWQGDQISFIRDYKYVRYVIDDAELVMPPDTGPPARDPHIQHEHRFVFGLTWRPGPGLHVSTREYLSKEEVNLAVSARRRATLGRCPMR